MFDLKQDFESLRSTALCELLRKVPLEGVPVLTSSVLSSAVTLGLRVNCLAWMCNVAQRLMHGDKKVSSSSIGGKGSSDAEAVAIVNGATTSRDLSGGGTTTIKRPKKLEQHLAAQSALTSSNTSVSTEVENRFAPIADLFFYPILQLLITTLQPRNSRNTSKVEKFGFDSDLPNANEYFLNTITSTSGKTDFKVEASLKGADAYVPAQALQALVCFTGCAVNSNWERFVSIQ